MVIRQTLDTREQSRLEIHVDGRRIHKKRWILTERVWVYVNGAQERWNDGGARKNYTWTVSPSREKANVGREVTDPG